MFLKHNTINTLRLSCLEIQALINSSFFKGETYKYILLYFVEF
jgi:hypothetical protein